MPPLTVRDLRLEDLDAAAGLLAARHKRDRARLPMFAASLEEPAAARKVLEPQVTGGRATSLLCLRGDAPAGFLIGETMTLPPDHFASQYIPPHSGEVEVQGHAVAPGEDPTAVYRALYAELAARWVSQGFFWHRLHIVAGDPELQEAWVALGFGRTLTAAVRPVADAVPMTREAGIEVHRAGAEDIDVVMELAETLALHHTLAPMFWPFLHTTDAAARAFNLHELEQNTTPYFIAYQDGKLAGAQTFLRPGFTPGPVDHTHDIYLYEGVVQPDVRSGGVGTALLAHSMRWAAEQGYQTCTLHFASGNFSGAPFWLGHGFQPVEHTMERRIDERIAWANR